MKTKVAFLCVHNSCRSQMAEGFALKYGKDKLEVYSAGSEDYPEVKPKAIEVMKEVGISLKDHRPKLLNEIPKNMDIVITMGCEIDCPFIPSKYQEDWGLEDPSGKDIEAFRKTRDLIESKVIDLIKNIQ